MRYIVFLLSIILSANAFVSAQTIPYSSGRIIISSDGNEHDHDDWAATPLSLALLAARGLQDKLVAYNFGDHLWGSNHDHNNALEQMRISAIEGGSRFGFNNTKFIEAVTYPDSAVAVIVAEINRSIASDPLTIIEAGPMELVGRALEASDKEKLKFVRLISHSRWNDNHADQPAPWEDHTGWTWAKIEDEFKNTGLILDHILDQNGGRDYTGLRAPVGEFDWLKNPALQNLSIFGNGNQNWLYERLLTCVKRGEFDPSDSGMIVYLLTGIKKTSPSDAQAILEHPLN